MSPDPTLDDSGDGVGFSVSGAGDVNGDGIDDLIVGAQGGDPGGRISAGESYVVFGTTTGFDPNLGLSGLDGTNGFRLDGVDGGDASGFSVSGAGDVNADGLADVVVGAPNAGESYVVFGSAEAFSPSVDLSALDGANGFRLAGLDPSFDFNRISVSGAGDVNGDGIDDLIVGVPYTSSAGRDFIGRSYVVFGSDTGFGPSLDVSTLDGERGFSLEGEAQYDAFGQSVSRAGDVNGDGIDDFVVGAPSASVSQSGEVGRDEAGKTYVIFGARNEDQPEPPNWTLTPTSIQVPETREAVTFELARSPAATPQTVYVSVLENQGFTNDDDFTAFSDVPLTFAAGESGPQTIAVRLNPDDGPEADESFELVVTADPGDPAADALANAVFTIEDNRPPEVGAVLARPTFQEGERVPLTALFPVTDPDGDAELDEITITTTSQVRLVDRETGEETPLTSLFTVAPDAYDRLDLRIPAPGPDPLGIEVAARDVAGDEGRNQLFVSSYRDAGDAPLILSLDGRTYNLGNTRELGDPETPGSLNIFNFEPFDVESGETVQDPDLLGRLYLYASGLDLARGIVDKGQLTQADERLAVLLSQIEDAYNIDANELTQINAVTTIAATLAFPPTSVFGAATLLVGFAISTYANETWADFEFEVSTKNGSALLLPAKVEFSGAFDAYLEVESAVQTGNPISADRIEQVTEGFLWSHYVYAAGGALLGQDPALQPRDFNFFFDRALAIFSPVLPKVAGAPAVDEALSNAASILDNALAFEDGLKIALASGFPIRSVFEERGISVPAADYFSPDSFAEAAARFRDRDVEGLASVQPSADDSTVVDAEAFEGIRIFNKDPAFGERGEVVIENYDGDVVIFESAPGGIAGFDTAEGSVVLDISFEDPDVDPFTLRLEGEFSGRLESTALGSQTFLSFSDGSEPLIEGTDAADVLVAGAETRTIAPRLGADSVFVERLPIAVSGTVEELDGDELLAFGDTATLTIDGTITDVSLESQTSGEIATLVVTSPTGDEALITLKDSEGGLDQLVPMLDVAGDETFVSFETAPSKPVIEGPAIGGMLAGTPADEVLVPGAGALTTVSGNGGADDVDLRAILGDGARQVVRVLDYEQDDRLLGPTADDVLYAFESGSTTTLLLDGGDRDQIMVTGAPTQDDITFADPDLFVA